MVINSFIYSDKSENGPWKMVLQKTLDDSRKQIDPLPLQEFSIASTQGRFVKFELVSYYGHGGGLEYFNINNNGPKVVKSKSISYPHHKDQYTADHVLTKSGKKEEHGKNYWVAPNKATGRGFVIDYGSIKTFNLVELVNTHNAQSRDRSTKEFKVKLRYDFLHIIYGLTHIFTKVKNAFKKPPK